jgi:hypothetical protein
MGGTEVVGGRLRLNGRRMVQCNQGGGTFAGSWVKNVEVFFGEIVENEVDDRDRSGLLGDEAGTSFHAP